MFPHRWHDTRCARPPANCCDAREPSLTSAGVPRPPIPPMLWPMTPGPPCPMPPPSYLGKKEGKKEGTEEERKEGKKEEKKEGRKRRGIRRGRRETKGGGEERRGRRETHLY